MSSAKPGSINGARPERIILARTFPARFAGRSLEEWNAAYVKVENYFHALRIRNKPLLGQLVLRVLERAQCRAPAEPGRSATEIAAEEMDRIVTDWFGEVLQTSPVWAASRCFRRARPPCAAPRRHAGQMAGPVSPSRARGRRNSSSPCAKVSSAPARISSWRK